MAINIIQRFDNTDIQFDKAKSDTYQLIIQLGNDFLNYTVFDPQLKEFLSLKSFSIQSSSGDDQLVNALKQMNRQEIFWELAFAKVSVFNESAKFTFIPDEVFHQGKILDYAKLNMQVMPEDSIFMDAIHSQHCRNISLINGNLVNEFKNIFTKCGFHHLYSPLIDTLAAENNAEGKKIFAIVRQQAFTLVVLEKDQLKFCNYFAYKTAEDFIYFVLAACDQLNLNPETVPFVLLGDIEKRSAVFQLAFKYIRDVSIGGRPRRFHYSPALDQIPSQYFFDLFSCAS